MPKKLIVIGIDGADPEYIDKGIKQNKLPTFSKLIKDGSYCKLKSTIPPLSLPAWPSIYTGKNPGKIGIYNFVQLQEGSYETEIVDWKIPETIWQILSKHNKKVAVINNYFTYPPDEVNGVMITSIDNIEKGCYYPKELEIEVEKKIGKLDFGLIPPYYAIPKRQLTKLTDKMLKTNVKLVRYVIKNYEFDFLITTLDIDRLHHLVVDESELLKWYSKIDGFVAEIIQEAKQINGDMNLILLSDHGGGKMKKEFYINEFLKEKGFLKLKQKYKSKSSKFLVKIGFSMENLLKFIQVTKIDRILLKILPYKVWDIAKSKVPRKDVPFSEAEIDWLNTKAFSPFPSTGAIQINLAGREPYGIVKKQDYNKIVDEVVNELKNLECEGEKIKVDVYRKEQIYSGPYLDNAPDITLVVDDWRYFPKISFSGQLFKEPRDPGHHRCYGFILANGKDFKKTKIKNAEVYDIAPSILKLFGILLPKDIDGKVLDILK